MKKTLLGASLLLGLFAVSFASAQDYLCTTDDNGGACDKCVFTTWGGVLCRWTEPDGRMVQTYKYLDDCVENREGEMRPGLGATQSCDGFHLEDNLLHAKCRNGAGEEIESFIDIRDYFVVRDPPATTSKGGYVRFGQIKNIVCR